MGFPRQAVVVAVLSAVTVLGACGDDEPDDGSGVTVLDGAVPVSNDVHGSVSEWKVEVDAATAEKGDVEFEVANKGTIQHEFLVVKTTYGPGMIPVGADSRFAEDDPGITVVDEIAEWAPGETKQLKVDLEPGKYELVCNVAGHYGNGMHTSFEVVD